MKTFEVQTKTKLTKVKSYAPNILVTGCSFRQVYIRISYNSIVAILGKPTITGANGGGKIQVEWILENEEKTKTISIYDWKEYDTPYEDVNHWNVGGNYSKEESYKILIELGFLNTQLERADY